MADPSSAFSESWYRVAGQRVSLRSYARVQRQVFRGERWFVLANPFTNQFFRLRPAAYEFVGRLRPERTVEQVWQECVERFPDDAPGQEAVIQLLAQLYQAGLLQYDLAGDTAKVFERYQKGRQRELRSRLANLMFIRVPLWDPDAFLVRALPVVRWLFSPVGAVLWLVVVGLALKVVADNFTALKNQAQGILAPDNLFWLYGALVLIKTLHELGHAFCCRRFGGEVHIMGVLFMIFTPIPYMDATSAWGFRARWQRVLVGSAGMVVEVFVAALATFVWANTGQGVWHSLAYNLMFVASVSTLLFNLNPLLRFDGYYILADWVGIPNLAQRANRQLRYWTERHLFGLRKEESPAHSRREAAWLGVYGVTSGVYRVIVFAGVLLMVADRFLLIGLLMAAVCAVSWVAVPLGRLVYYLAASPKLERQRSRAVAVVSALAGVVVLFLQFTPFPHHFRAPGIVRCREWSGVYTLAGGRVAALVTAPGGCVAAGQPLVRLANPELELEWKAAQAQREEVNARIRQALRDAVPNLKPLTNLLESVTKKCERLQADLSRLTVRAPHAGLWVAPQAKDYVGRWLPKGAELGLLVNPDSFQFHAIARQEDADRLFSGSIPRAEARLYGRAGECLAVSRFTVIPGEQRELPSAALGWGAGGPVPTAPNDPQGRKAAEPFFEVRADLAPSAGVALLHGRGGRIRFDLPPEPLLPRWVRALRQLLQERYQL